MTAEIVVMNREAVALAADSAVTTRAGGIEKISTSANKLFALSMHHPVGIMLYGNALFMSVPWETIIKVYRVRRLPKNGFNTLEEYADDFISFLDTKNIQFPEVAEDNYIGSFVEGWFDQIRNKIDTKITEALRQAPKFDEGIIRKIASDVISQYYDECRRKDGIRLVPVKLSRSIMRKYRRGVDRTIKEKFQIYSLSKEFSDKLKEILVQAFSKSIFKDISSGIVVAGFGENDVLPSVKAFEVEGIVSDQLKYRVDSDHSLGTDTRAGVIPFAQGEMVHRFMDGVDPFYRYGEETYLTGLCHDYAEKVVARLRKYDNKEKGKIKQELLVYGDRLIGEFIDNMKVFIEKYFSDPTVEAVSRLPKSELAAMAEALVYLTSLKRKVSPEPETVAEPIDVAVISKGDGFVWVRRKHYFKAELNPQYFIKRYKELLDEYQKGERREVSLIDETLQ